MKLKRNDDTTPRYQINSMHVTTRLDIYLLLVISPNNKKNLNLECMLSEVKRIFVVALLDRRVITIKTHETCVRSISNSY